MTEKRDRKYGIEFSALKAAASHKAAVWSEINGMRTEIDRKRSELQLLEQDMENLKREAGNYAFQLWKNGSLNQEAFDELFKEAMGKETNRSVLETVIADLEARIEEAKQRAKEKSEKQAAPNHKETEKLLERPETEYPIQCPTCGFRFKKTANFCRKCGARLDEDNKENKAEVLETPRLSLRKLEAGDYESLCKILKDPETMYAYEHGFSEEEVQEWLNRQLERYQKDGFGLWGVILKESGEFVGQCGITMQEVEGHQVMEVGYLFNRSFWHRGYAAEAAAACRDYAFKTLQATEVYSIIRDSNTTSIRVAEKNGMERCGEITKHYFNMDMPHYIYKITKETWQARK